MYSSILSHTSFSNLHATLKLRSYGLSFYKLRPRFALLPVVGTGKIDVVRGLVSASVVARDVEVNGSHVKGGGVARRCQCIRSLERCREICQATSRGNGATTVYKYSTDHSPQVRTSSESRFDKPHAVGTSLYEGNN
ncbi:hypothetical protein AVEN_166984-1 [Araneus ventricosus]|uniref:Uncharacterized protein n=1 Tax=Araneus ventricosus TaxID=182803 RepID=A0A4Y2GYR3_ARAVE|nr:hypothetical protein AVEN_166984-1 [Araneus ventricosus]